MQLVLKNTGANNATQPLARASSLGYILNAAPFYRMFGQWGNANLIDETAFGILFSNADHTSQSWFLDPTTLSTTGFSVMSTTLSMGTEISAVSSTILGYVQYTPADLTYSEGTMDSGLTGYLGFSAIQKNITYLNPGVAKYAYVIKQISTSTVTSGYEICRLDVTDSLGTNAGATNYELYLDNCNFVSGTTRRVKSFNAKITYTISQ